MDFKKYWTEDKGENITAGYRSNPEGFDVPEFLRHLLGCVEQDIGKPPTVHDLGCGTGRLCSVSSPDRYIGSDLSPGSIARARELNPDYTDVYWVRGNIYYERGEYENAIADYRQYEAITGQLEPFMAERIAEMEAD